MITAPEAPQRPSASPSIAVVDELDSLREDWARLAESSGNLFSTWEWSELWWRHYGGERPLRIAVSRDDDDEIDAIVPLFVWSRRPMRTLRLLGHGHGDRLGPISADEDARTATRALRLALANEPHDVFVGDWVAGDRDWAGELDGRVVRTTGYPVLELRDDSWPEFLSRQSQRFRKSVRFGRNRLEREREVSYRYAGPATLDRDLDAAFRLHRSRFGDHAGCNFCGEHEAFQREFAEIALERGWLRLLLLEIDGQPVGCEYGFFFQGAYFAYQGGRDPAWNRESVGFLLEVESIRRTFEEGGAEYRFLGGEEEYKYRYTAYDPRLETVVVPATARGRVLSTALNAAWGLPGARSLLRRVASARAGRPAP
jgi:CelD/BcsL family acetyltransferase involved in cellulose biosynthesis